MRPAGMNMSKSLQNSDDLYPVAMYMFESSQKSGIAEADTKQVRG